MISTTRLAQMDTEATAITARGTAADLALGTFVLELTAEVRALQGNLAAAEANARQRMNELALDLAAEQARSARLIRPVIASAHLTAGDRRAPLWSLVADLFALGSTRAEALCRAHGYDPDQEVTRRRGPKPLAHQATP